MFRLETPYRESGFDSDPSLAAVFLTPHKKEHRYPESVSIFSIVMKNGVPLHHGPDQRLGMD